MIRIVGFLVGVGFTVVVLFAFVTGLFTVISDGELKPETAEHEFHLKPKHVEFEHDGVMGKWDLAQLQRGYQVYKEVCAACHGLNYVAFRDLGALGYDEGQVKALAAQWTVPGIDPNTGEANTRPGVPTDSFPSPYANRVAAAAANNNAVPPDLSLITKARHHGPAYVYSLLTGYKNPAAYKNAAGETLAKAWPESMPGTGLHFNPYFPNLNLAMAPPLSDGQVTFADGSPNTVDAMAKDVSAFLTWTAEPKLVERKQSGWPVVGFLLFATVLAFFAKQQVWAGAKRKKAQ